jgi:uncharacterized RDD family membrane protein YckC
MKCPKCGYLGFESVDRCRNCGYDFSLSPIADILELPLKPMPVDGDRTQSPSDLSFLDAVMTVEPVRRGANPRPEGQRLAAGDLVRARAQNVDELPLFGSMIPDDLPLITRPSPPRSPLAVRRATPEVPRLRSVSGRAATLDLDLEPLVPALAPRVTTRMVEAAPIPTDDGDTEQDAPIVARLTAFVIDILILAAIDAAVVYFTMQICGVTLEDFRILPRAPLLAFLLVQNGGYLVAFTAGGQTLGKIAAGIRVVSAESPTSLDLGQAFMRELIWLVLALPAGLGLLTILRRDHRGVHDRFAGTRVVRD